MSVRSGWCIHGVLHHLSRVWWNNHHFLQRSKVRSRRIRKDNFDTEMVLSAIILILGIVEFVIGILGCHLPLYDETLRMLLWQSTATGELSKSDLSMVSVVQTLRRSVV